MVSFLAAFSFMCFENSSLITRALVAVVWAAVAALILWCVFTAWESDDWDWLRGLFSWRPFPNNDAAVDADADGDGDAEVKSALSHSESKKSKPTRKRRWWPSMSINLRKGSVDSERTVTNV